MARASGRAVNRTAGGKTTLPGDDSRVWPASASSHLPGAGVADRPSDFRQRLGREGEAAAEVALRRAGQRILDRRFRCRQGEIDLVAEDGDVVVFIEVKTRRGTAYGSPAEAVTPRKRRRMVLAAWSYLAARGLHDRPCRFDVVEIVGEPGKGAALRHIRDAFRPGMDD